MRMLQTESKNRKRLSLEIRIERRKLMTEAYIPVLNTVISSAISLAVAFGTWHVSMKKDREKQVDEVKEVLDKHREEYLTGIQDVKNDVAKTNTHIALVDEKISTLSDRVEKHNNVIERTYALETRVGVIESRI